MWARENDFDAEISAAAAGNPQRIAILKALCGIESSFNPAAMRREPDGRVSYGLTQILDQTARGLGYTGELRLLLDPALHLGWAMRYLLELEGQVGTSNMPELFSAWNCGAQRRADAWHSRCARPGQTYVNQAYVDKAMRAYSYFSGQGGGGGDIASSLSSIPPQTLVLVLVAGVAVLVVSGVLG